MAELTELDEKIGEVYGLSQAAQNATDKVSKLVEDDQIVTVLQRMHDEAAETEQRLSCTFRVPFRENCLVSRGIFHRAYSLK